LWLNLSEEHVLSVDFVIKVIHFPVFLSSVDLPLENTLVINTRGEQTLPSAVHFNLVDEAHVPRVGFRLTESRFVDVLSDLIFFEA
jgi:hypothetical protein